MSYASKYVDAFLEGMDKSGTTLYNSIIGYVRGMDEDDIGLVSGYYNDQSIEAISSALQDFVNTPAYEDRIEKLLNSLPSIATAVARDSSKKFGSIPEEVIDEMLKTQDLYLDQLQEVLDDQAVEYAILSPYVNRLYQLIGEGAEVSEAVTYTQDYLPDALHSYYITKVTTLLELYERELYDIIANANEVEYFEYVGPIDERNREFCSQHVGNVYSRQEIEELSLEEWNGKIPGTDAISIFVNLGGYNCRHILEPVKK